MASDYWGQRAASSPARAGAGAGAGTSGGRCCCYGGCCDCPKDFQKVLELKDIGLVVYRHTARTEGRNKTTGLLESSTKTKEDVFILVNTKGSQLPSGQYLPGLEITNISCPRCGKFAKQVHNMLQKAPNMSRRDASGICQRCLMREKPCSNCQRILEEFMSNRREMSEGTKTLIRQWLNTIQHIIEEMTGVSGGGGVGGVAGPPLMRTDTIRATSDLYIDRVFMRSHKDSRELDIKPLFRPVAIKLDERGRFVEDRSRFYGSDISTMFDMLGGRERRETTGRDKPSTSRALPSAPYGTRRSHSDESIPYFARTSKGETARSGPDYGESDKFQEDGYNRRGEGRNDYMKSQRYREGSEIYERGDTRYRKGTGADTTADSELGRRYDTDRSIDELGKSKGRGKEIDERKYGDSAGAPFDGAKGERSERKKEQGSKEILKTEKVEQKQRDKVQTDRSHPDKGGFAQQDQRNLKNEKELSTKDKVGQEYRQRGEKELSTKDRGGQEQRQRGEKELSSKDRGGQEQRQKGEKEFSSKNRGGQEQRQKEEKELGTKDRGGQEQKQKGEKELSTKDRGGQEQKHKGEKELSTKDRGGQDQRQKGEKELSTKDRGGQEQKQKGEKELSTKDRGGQEQKQKGEKELSTKDRGRQEQKQKGEKELSTKDRGGQEQKQKGEKELSTKDRGGQEQKQKGEKELSTKDRGGLEQKQKGEKELSTKDRGGQEQKQKGEKELSAKDRGGQDQRQKGEKGLSTKEKSGQEPKQKERKESITKDKGGTEQKLKGEKELHAKDKIGQEQKQNGDKDLGTKDKSDQEPKQKGKSEKDKADTTTQKEKVGKESDSKNKGEADTKKKETGDKGSDAKGRNEKETKQDQEKEKQDKAFMDLMGDKMKGGPRERERIKKDENATENVPQKQKKTGKKRDESKKDEDKADDPNKKREPILGEKDLPANKIQVRRASPDDLFLRLVKLKEADPAETLKNDDLKNIKELFLRQHFDYKHGNDQFQELCPFCRDSNFGSDTLAPPPEPDTAELIIGSKVYVYKPPLSPTNIEDEQEHLHTIEPIQFKTDYHIDNIVQVLLSPKEEPSPPPVPAEAKKDSKKSGKPVKAPEPEPSSNKGIIHFQLSDRSFIEKGWTMLPTEKVVRKMNVYRMRPAHPEFDWFEHNKRKGFMNYESGERLAEMDEAGRGRWYYRNGRLALDYYDAEGLNAQQRFVVWSSGEPDERGRAQPYTILATFDYLGNGIVFDHTGKIRLKYNQTEGIVLDRNIGPVSHWKWHTLNDPPVLAQVMIDTQETHQDPRLVKLGERVSDRDAAAAGERLSPDNDDMLAIEFDNFVRAKNEKLTQAFKPFQIKMKALKINDYFSLKVLDQATVYLIYRDGRTNLKLNLGMVLDHREIVDTDMAEMGEVASELERFPARTASLAALQRGVQAAQRWERRRAARDQRLQPGLPAPASLDRLAAAASRPLPAPPASTTPSCRCTRKPTAPNLYYDNRIF